MNQNEPSSSRAITLENETRRQKWTPHRELQRALVGQSLCVFIISLDMTILTVTLPTIARTIDANATETIWIAAAYLLANTVCQPLVAGLANVVGHKCLFIGGVLAFTAGSITCAVARNVAVMILGRTIQGVGGGSILSINLILLCKHVEPPYRPAYQGYMQLIFALGTNIAPIVGGAFASTHWRWVFFVNLPFCGIALASLPFLLLKEPQIASYKQLCAIDWVGSLLIAVGSTAFLVGMSWGGIKYPWHSPAVLVPIAVGLWALVLTVIYEWKTGKQASRAIPGCATLTGGTIGTYNKPIPFLDFQIFKHSSGLLVMVCTMLQSYLLYSLTYYLVIYLIACKLFSPLLSGVIILPFGLMVVPVSGITGKVITISRHYRWAIWSGWLMTTLGSGLLILLDVHTPPAAVVFIFMCAGAGQGLLFSSQASVMQATCSNENAVQSMCMYSFMRSWGLCLGVVLGGTVVQNFLRMRLSYQDLPTGSAADIDGLIPLLQSLPNSSPLRALLRSAYAWALQKLFITNTAVSFMGGLMTLFIPDYSIDTLGHMGQTAQIFHIDSTVGSRTHAPRT